MSAGENLIVNPGFETGDFTGWNAILNTQIYSPGYIGSYCARVYGLYSAFGPIQTTGVLEQEFTVELGKTYQIWLKAKNEHVSDFKVILDKGDGNEIVIFSDYSIFDWKLILWGYSYEALGTDAKIKVTKKYPAVEGSAYSYVDYFHVEEEVSRRRDIYNAVKVLLDNLVASGTLKHASKDSLTLWNQAPDYPSAQLYYAEERKRVYPTRSKDCELELRIMVYVKKDSPQPDVDAALSAIENEIETNGLGLNYILDNVVTNIFLGVTADDIQGIDGVARLHLLVTYRHVRGIT